MVISIVFALTLAAHGVTGHALPARAPTVTNADVPGGTPVAPVLSGLGTWSTKVTTSNPRAQAFFDQGLRLTYGFNHAEAIRAFREAARLDPDCAMAYWGHAYALGPNINAPMSVEAGKEAHAVLQKALALKARVSERERALIDALTARYAPDGAGDRTALDAAYRAAMAEVAVRFPDDPDVLTLHAEAIMDTMPWNYWNKDGSPRDGTATVMASLEKAFGAHPDHAGAHHFYIHILEANDPDRAVPSADVLGALMPGAGHMVHMPGHIYLRVGRYADAALVNERAVAADEDYISQCQAQGLYPVGYYPHNLHFLWAASTMEGRSSVAIQAAQKVGTRVPHHLSATLPWIMDLPMTPLFSYVRFGRWTEILTEPKPADDYAYPLGIWHYARAIAFAARGQFDRADAEVAALEQVRAREVFASKELQETALPSNLAIAANTAAGETASRRGDHARAVALLKEAVALQDDQPYNEPPNWHYPVRQSLGAALLEAGQPGEAEAVYREDLRRNRANGWSLFGLAQSLKAQGKTEEASEVTAQFRNAWARADVTLTSSRF